MSRPDVHLIESDRPELELGEVRLHPDIEQILADEQWIGDATGLVPHCLAVLKTCHTLTERLAALAMGPLNHSKTGHEIVEVRAVTCFQYRKYYTTDYSHSCAVEAHSYMT
jgi:hypothetical protein